jgi:hypothetical protein
MLCEVNSPEEVASILLRTQNAEQTSIAAGFGKLLRRFDADHGQAEVVEVARGGGTRRQSRRAQGGDSTELWDERAHTAIFGEIDAARARSGLLKDKLGAIRAGGAR